MGFDKNTILVIMHHDWTIEGECERFKPEDFLPGTLAPPMHSNPCSPAMHPSTRAPCTDI